jgi:beta-lactamase superfamily II metal-dependent hydrolase
MEDCPGNTSDDKVRDVIEAKEIPVYDFSQSAITIDGVVFTILPVPPASDCPEEENKNSIVVRMDYGDFSMLFPGDAETEELEWLVQNNSSLLDVDILKASHHGSNNGTSEEWLNAVTPQRVVISVGVNATYKHPHQQAVEDYTEATGGKVYCTNRQGTIRIYGYKDGHCTVSTQRTSTESCVYTGE